MNAPKNERKKTKEWTNQWTKVYLTPLNVRGLTNFGRHFGRPIFGRPIFGRPIFGRPIFGQPVFGRPIFGLLNVGQPISGRIILSRRLISSFLACTFSVGPFSTCLSWAWPYSHGPFSPDPCIDLQPNSRPITSKLYRTGRPNVLFSIISETSRGNHIFRRYSSAQINSAACRDRITTYIPCSTIDWKPE